MKRFGDFLGRTFLRLGSAAALLILTGLVVVHVFDTADFILANGVPVPGFLVAGTWVPTAGDYGVAGFLRSSLKITAAALVFAFPAALLFALYVSEYAEPESRRRYTVLLNVLISMPTVIFGLFALMFVTPVLQRLLGTDRVQPYNILSAGLVIGVFLIPQITGILTDALRRSRGAVRDAALALGATRAEVTLGILLPDALPGLISAFILGFSRAFGESVIVGMVAGSGPRLNPGYLESGEPVAGLVLRMASGRPGPVFLVGSLLFIAALLLNFLGEWVGRRKVAEELR